MRSEGSGAGVAKRRALKDPLPTAQKLIDSVLSWHGAIAAQ